MEQKDYNTIAIVQSKTPEDLEAHIIAGREDNKLTIRFYDRESWQYLPSEILVVAGIDEAVRISKHLTTN